MPQAIPLVDSYGQMNQQSILTAPAVPPLVPQAQFQPQPYQQQTDSSASPGDSRHNSVTSGQLFAGTNAGNTNGGDVLMDDIDWVSDIYFHSPILVILIDMFEKHVLIKTALQNEFDKYFPVETNTGDLNLPDFDFSQFTGVGGFDNNTNNNNTTNNTNSNAPASSTSAPQRQSIDTTNTTATGTASTSHHATANNNNSQHPQHHHHHQREDLSDVNFGAMSFFPPAPGSYFAGPAADSEQGRNNDRNSRNRNS